ncbi:DUF4357 domain-containing protein [Lactobacillus terrae]|uniref:DUF4357 domain-containing protein n=1 Tax=Lactobacillus terrae TaxID=2269374 RepID=UPI000C1B7344|nr:DUF4357 domain-containing protein [Lactobacillus terrae]
MEIIKPFAINTSFPMGDPTGFRFSEIMTRPIQAFYISRNNLKEVIESRTELSRSGVFVLVDNFSSNLTRRNVYLGQSENVGESILDHNTQGEDWWDIVIAFVVNDKSHQLTKEEDIYLQRYMYKQAKNVDIANILNTELPKKPFLTESSKYALADIFENIDMLLQSFGYSLFTDYMPEDEESSYLRFNERGSEAFGKYTSEGMVVKRGSRISSEKPLDNFNGLLLKNLMNDGVIKEDIFDTDFVFSNPSVAANILAKSDVNGWLTWQNSRGQSLDEITHN